ncbi:MAG: DUF1629 domain-containing protein [Pseudomonadota bacterium]
MAYSIGCGIFPDEPSANSQEAVFLPDNGDFDNVRLIDYTQDEGGLIPQRGGLTVGRPYAPGPMPTKIKRDGRDAKRLSVLDVEHFYGQPLVIEAFKDIVEEHEPDVHQFFPMDAYIGEELVGKYFYFNVCNRLSTIHREKTFPLNERGFWKPKKGEPSAFVLSTELIGSHHAWRDKFGHGCYISDKLGGRLIKEGFSGINFLTVEEA